jgi:hypothetical protein
MTNTAETTSEGRNQWYRILFFLPVIFILVAVFFQNKRKSEEIDECPRFTIGYTAAIKRKKIEYRYTLYGGEYTNVWSVNPRNTSEFFLFSLRPDDLAGKRFLVRCNCRKPGISEIVWTHDLPNNITTTPYGGWQAIPSDFPETAFAD